MARLEAVTLAAAALCALPGLALALPDILVPRGAQHTAHVDRGADRYDLPVRPYGRGAPATERLYGRVVWDGYRIADPELSSRQVMEAYRAHFRERAFEMVFDCVGAGCGGVEFRFGVALLPPPEMLMDLRDFAQLSVKSVEPPVAYVSVLVSRALGAVHVQAVRVAPVEDTAPEPDLLGPLGAGSARPGAVDLPHDADEGLLARLRASGRAVVPGISFSPGGAALARASEPALERLAGLLAAEPGLAVVIVGHSDNRGGLDANRALSRRRAEAVRRALIERGVAADRLAADGVGFLAPIASNASAEGRARNRRVELVLR